MAYTVIMGTTMNTCFIISICNLLNGASSNRETIINTQKTFICKNEHGVCQSSVSIVPGNVLYFTESTVYSFWLGGQPIARLYCPHSLLVLFRHKNTALQQSVSLSLRYSVHDVERCVCWLCGLVVFEVEPAWNYMSYMMITFHWPFALSHTLEPTTWHVCRKDHAH